MSFNQITIQGYLGGDPEVRYQPNGEQIANFSIPVTEKTKRGDETTWFRCSAFGSSAEFITQYMKKGSFVTVFGRMKSKGYEKDGVKMTAWTVNVDRVYSGPRTEQRPEPSRYDMRAEREEPDDIIPF